jgi:hypothetical protein
MAIDWFKNFFQKIRKNNDKKECEVVDLYSSWLSGFKFCYILKHLNKLEEIDARDKKERLKLAVERIK